MSDWQNRLDLKDLWKARRENDMPVQDMAKQVAIRIRKMKCYKDYEDKLDDIATEFEECDENVGEFDGILEELYDWADTPLETPKGEMQKKICWIATSF